MAQYRQTILRNERTLLTSWRGQLDGEEVIVASDHFVFRGWICFPDPVETWVGDDFYFYNTGAGTAPILGVKESL